MMAGTGAMTRAMGTVMPWARRFHPAKAPASTLSGRATAKPVASRLRDEPMPRSMSRPWVRNTSNTASGGGQSMGCPRPSVVATSSQHQNAKEYGADVGGSARVCPSFDAPEEKEFEQDGKACEHGRMSGRHGRAARVGRHQPLRELCRTVGRGEDEEDEQTEQDMHGPVAFLFHSAGTPNSSPPLNKWMKCLRIPQNSGVVSTVRGLG